MKHTFFRFGLPLLAMVAMAMGCKRDKTQTALEYMPNMYRGPALEAYSAGPAEYLNNAQSALLPPQGSVPRGYEPYGYTNTQAGYDSALAYLRSPHSVLVDSLRNLAADSLRLAEGKELYAIFCTHCHGEKGDGNGTLVQNEKFLGVPSYASDRLPNITEGSIFHVITHGKNLMGSHASQITAEERWKIVHYVWKLRSDLAPKPVAAPSDSTQTEA